MSAINDALSKVQQQRKEVVATKASSRTATRRSPTGQEKSAARTPLYIWVFANITVLVLVWAGYQLFFRQTTMTEKTPVVSLAPVTDTSRFDGLHCFARLLRRLRSSLA